MDTKWKNMVKAIKKFIKEYYDCVFGALMFIIGSFLFFVMLVNRYYFSTWGVWRICLIGNILVQPGICLLVRRYMKLRYRNWSQKGSAETYLQDTEDSIYYQTWKAKEKQSEKRFRNILAVELSAAAAYLFFISYSSRWGWNYAAGYMMVATVFIEYICCREVIQRYWRNELDQIMEQTESFFQKRLEQALEIERKSLEKVSRSDQLRVDLITNVSHDLKTPLTSIVGYLELIRNDLLVVSDEIYSQLVYDGAEHVSVASIPGMKERTITLGGFSKAYSMTGWRLGYMCAPEGIISACVRVHQYTITCASSFVQDAAIVALNECADDVEAMRQEYQRRKDFMVKALNDIDGISCNNPQGAFYIFVNVKSLGMTSMEVAEYLLEHAKVALVPGSAFGSEGEGYLRISYACSYEDLQEAAKRIREAVAELKAR